MSERRAVPLSRIATETGFSTRYWRARAKAGEMPGAVRLMLDADHESGEFAILLRSDQQGRGLGRALMKMMIDYGEMEGLKHIEGQVLAENATMLAMCRQLGFQIRDEPDDAGAKQVRLDLTPRRGG